MKTRITSNTPHTRSRGVTLVELLVGMTIATLMTVAGWRAIDAMQTARDETVTDAARWQAIDTLFATMEADLRRADLRSFVGDATSLSLQLNPLTPTDAMQTVRYELIASDGAATRAVRTADSGSALIAEFRAGRFAYRTPAKAASASSPAVASATVAKIDEYPRAIEIALDVLGHENTPRVVTRLLVLR
jgi:Prokaryotic N-terminal methylation motif